MPPEPARQAARRPGSAAKARCPAASWCSRSPASAGAGATGSGRRIPAVFSHGCNRRCRPGRWFPASVAGRDRRHHSSGRTTSAISRVHRRMSNPRVRGAAGGAPFRRRRGSAPAFRDPPAASGFLRPRRPFPCHRHGWLESRLPSSRIIPDNPASEIRPRAPPAREDACCAPARRRLSVLRQRAPVSGFHFRGEVVNRPVRGGNGLARRPVRGRISPRRPFPPHILPAPNWPPRAGPSLRGSPSSPC